jgi:hypothetical protein
MRLAFVIQAIDRSTKVVDAISKRVDKLGEPARRVAGSFRGLVRAAGFDRIRDRIDVMNEAGGLVAGWARGAARSVLAIGAAGAGAAFGISRVVDEVDRTVDTAKKLGIGVEQYQRMGYAAKLNGSNQEEMGQALQFLSQNMVEAINGSKEAATWFARAGIPIERLRKMNAAQVFEAIADKFSAVGDAGQNAEKKIALMRALMGRGGAELKQVLDLGSEGLRKFYGEADKLGAVVGQKDAEAMADFNDEVDRMGSGLKGVMVAIVSSALPALNDIVKRTTAWAVANRGLIAKGVAEFVERVLPRLPAFAEAVLQIGGAVAAVLVVADQFAQAIGGWETVIAVVAGVILGKGLLALYGLSTALWGVGAAFLATPFGWFAAGVAAVIGLAVLVYKKWEPIKQFFAGLWDSILSGLRKLDSMMPEWVKKYTLPGIALNGLAQAAGPAPAVPAPALPTAPGAARAAQPELGGTLKIEIDGDGKPRVRELKKAPGSALDFDVYAGVPMAAL